MSENVNRKDRDFSGFDSMSTEELEEILRLDAEKPEGEESDIDELYYIMEVLARRRECDENYTGKSVEEAFETFKKHYMPRDVLEKYNIQMSQTQVVVKKRRKPIRWLRAAVAAAAVLAVCILASVSADAMGLDLWGKVATWSKEFFHFEDETSGAEVSEPDMQDEIEYHSLQDALDELKISRKLAPTWVPDGYVIKDIFVVDSPSEISIYAKYEYNESKLRVSIRQLLNTLPEQIEKSENLIEIYISNGITYYIFSNYTDIQAAWTIDEFECFIAGPLTIDEIKMIIDSI